ncbi:MAG: ABC transporter permease [Lachnospiraceae bacterium]|nr:ABC transporter permease [Lachnospiraceae bacterium]
MRFRDMFLMSLSSLWKRKVRTILTILGVIIGTASIVVMISLGLGLKRASLAEIEQYGGLTTITVSEKSSYEMEDDQKSKKSKEAEHLDDNVLEMLSGLEYVDYAYPELDCEAIVMTGKYSTYITLRGVPADSMHHLGLKIGQGQLPSADDDHLRVVYGNCVIGDFSNEKTGEGYWYTGELPEIDMMNDRFTYVFDTDRYLNFLWGAEDENGQPAPMPKKYLVETAAVLEGNVEDYNSNSYSVYCDLEQLRRIVKKEFRGRVIPGQPTTKSGKPVKGIFYNSIIVGVDDMDHVSKVQSVISQMGYSAESNADWVESMQGQYKNIQLALGGIGAVSLLVAAIGIANTMMMSIYERTKEIGIMKVLGCDLKNIQAMFLIEAGYIGLLGGIFGSALSWGLSFTINHFINSGQLGIDAGSAAGISYIPLWLILLAVIFSILVAMIAGFFPSLRAMRLSPLAAIRNE